MSDSLVMYMRLMTSGYLRNNAILFEAYLTDGMTMEHFCQTEVEPIDKDSDQVILLDIFNEE
jgi:ubiquitin thioesterase protein OTUB1